MTFFSHLLVLYSPRHSLTTECFVDGGAHWHLSSIYPFDELQLLLPDSSDGTPGAFFGECIDCCSWGISSGVPVSATCNIVPLIKGLWTVSGLCRNCHNRGGILSPCVTHPCVTWPRCKKVPVLSKISRQGWNQYKAMHTRLGTFYAKSSSISARPRQWNLTCRVRNTSPRKRQVFASSFLPSSSPHLHPHLWYQHQGQQQQISEQHLCVRLHSSRDIEQPRMHRTTSK